MEIAPDHHKLLSARLPAEELQAAFNIALMNAAADCDPVASPDSLRAEFGESLAANLAMMMPFAPEEAEMHRIVLADYLRFCRMYSAGSEVADDGFDRSVLRSLAAPAFISKICFVSFFVNLTTHPITCRQSWILYVPIAFVVARS